MQDAPPWCMMLTKYFVLCGHTKAELHLHVHVEMQVENWRRMLEDGDKQREDKMHSDSEVADNSILCKDIPRKRCPPKRT